jgi:uncharacterized membrane protein YcaP (DUF421 family)
MTLLDSALGLSLDPRDLGMGHVVARSVVVFAYVLFLMRIAKRRFMAQRNPLDMLLGFLLASMISRAINGSAPFGVTLIGALTLVLLHRGLSVVTFHSAAIRRWCNGMPAVIVRDGVVDEAQLRRHRIDDDDLGEHLRLAAGTDDLSRIARATFERNGMVSVQKAGPQEVRPTGTRIRVG